MSPANTPQDVAQPSPQVLAGRTFKMMRETHGLGLRELAGLAEISPSHLSRIESGERAATADLTERICTIIAALPAQEKAS